ncbi:PucR family transcriptional regulator ligand-binding domain-containing protein, partial [Neobacillus niacini]|uniref:PucR family transcriptional regulator ligand-binding domain-containing protein n=1 Tax=Neobacillus niacini TaxID=86668 RepID=UPI00300226F5
MVIVLKKLVEQHTWKLESMNSVDYSKIPILTITVMESLNLHSWIRGGEFLLTSTFTLPNEEEMLNSLISDLKALRVSALAIKVVDAQFQIPQSVIENSEKLQFPLFIIPNKLTYLDIMSPINSQIFYEHEMNVLKERIFSYLMLNENINDPVLQNVTKLVNLNLMDKHVTALSVFPYNESGYSVKELDKIFNKIYVQFSDLQQRKAIDTFLFLRKINSIDFLLISSEDKLKSLNVHKLLHDANDIKHEYENYKIGISSIKPIAKTKEAVEESIFCVEVNEMMGDSNAIDFEQV